MEIHSLKKNWRETAIPRLRAILPQTSAALDAASWPSRSSCALVISTPVSIVAALAAAARYRQVVPKDPAEL